MISPTDKITFVQTLSRQARLTAAYLKDDRGAAGLVIAMIIMIASFSALYVFLSKQTGPARELARLESVGSNETILKDSLQRSFENLMLV
jgi:hypothetical protein